MWLRMLIVPLSLVLSARQFTALKGRLLIKKTVLHPEGRGFNDLDGFSFVTLLGKHIKYVETTLNEKGR